MHRTIRPAYRTLNETLSYFIERLEKELGHGSRIVGILEIGSYAKGEAVSTSDHDLRVYVTLPDAYAKQTSGGRIFETMKSKLTEKFERFCNEYGTKPEREFDWYTFNNPLSEKLKVEINCNFEFGVCDFRFAEFEFNQLDREMSLEHQLLFQSDIVYDPDGFLAHIKQNLIGKIFPTLTEYYAQRHLSPYDEIYSHLKAEKHDAIKMGKSGQIQWVKWAVRCVRDAVWAKEYIKSGNSIYKKEEILSYIRLYMPQYLDWIEELYDWKTNEPIREALAREFIQSPETCFKKFNDRMPKLEQFYQDLNRIQ